MKLAFDLAIPLLGLYPKNPETPIEKNLCTPMFIAAQFTIAKYWKQPKCPSVNEWIKKLWYIYTMEFYAAGRKKELFSDVQGPMFVAMPVLVSEMFFLCHQPTHLLLSLGPWGSCPNSFPFSSSKHLPLANIVITLVPSFK